MAAQPKRAPAEQDAPAAPLVLSDAQGDDLKEAVRLHRLAGERLLFARRAREGEVAAYACAYLEADAHLEEVKAQLRGA